ncbi:S8 family serine peptidase [Marinobacter hydrocarbonoclasticus]|nr:S8 family serine peptidase [Marinobacter nauticus]
MSMKYQGLALAGIAAAMLAGPSAMAAEEGRYIVKFQQGKGQAVRAQVQAEKGKVKLDLPGRSAMAVSLSPGALKAMQNHPHVEYVEEDVKRYLLSEETPYGIPMVQADQLSDAAAGNTKVCIIDSGYDGGHEDLYHGGVVNGTDDPGTGSWNTDENGHGTHVAGTIAGVGGNNKGVVGVLPSGNLNLHIIKVFGADGWAYSSGLVAALDACKAARASGENMVINMSLGGDRKSRTEERAFNQANSEGILSIAAAGNDGNTRHSYPASYSSVVSVAAIDANKAIADFSQQTDQVEMAGPGVGVLSTVPMGSASIASLSVGGSAVDAAGMEGSPQGNVSGALADCGLGESACSAAAGKVCLIARGNISFSDKVLACEAGGGIGAIIYNNEPGQLYGTLGGVATSIPSVGISDQDGAALLGQLGATAAIDVVADHYAYFNGTSMATPHVVGVAALVWSHHATCSNDQIRAALNATAEDLGAAGRDNAFGNGLVQALAASDHLTANGCDGGDTGGGGGGGGNGGGGGKPGKGPNR